MNVQDYLDQWKKLNAIIINNAAEKLKWLDVANGITAQFGGERVQSSGSQQRMADALDIVADLQREIDNAKAQMTLFRRTIQQINATEYDVIHKRYIQDMEFKDIGASKGQSKSWATTVHGRALQNLQRILDVQEQEWVADTVSILQNM